MGLPRISNADWRGIMLDAIEPFHEAVISVYDKTQLGTDNKPLAIISRRRARVQKSRATGVHTEGGVQSPKRPYIIEFVTMPSDGLVLKDMIIRVHEGGDDPQLQDYVFNVISSAGSSLSVFRTIEAVTDLTPAARIP